MAKKTASKKKRPQTRGKASKTTGPAKGPLIPSFLSVLTRVVISKTGIVHPDKVTSFQKGPMVWLIFNRSGSDQMVTIDPKKFVDATSNMPDNPLNTDSPLTVSVPDAGKKRGVIIGVLRDDANQISYHYEIAATNLLSKLVKTIDPDLDVVDPTP
jgi:hypothetical protein